MNLRKLWIGILATFAIIQGCATNTTTSGDPSPPRQQLMRRDSDKAKLQGLAEGRGPWPTAITFFREGPTGHISGRTFVAEVQNAGDRLSNIRVWRRGQKVVGLQIESQSSTGKRWGAVVGRQDGTRYQIDFGDSETLIEADGPLADSQAGVRTLRFKTLPISRDSGAKVLGDAVFYDTGDYKIPIELDEAWLRSNTFYSADNGYPATEVAGFWGDLNGEGEICALGVIRQHSPKHIVGYTPFRAGQSGEAGPVGEDPVEPRVDPLHPRPNRIGISIKTIRSWVDQRTRRIVGLRLDWYDQSVSPMVIGRCDGEEYKRWELAYNAGLVRIFADFDRDGYLNKLELLVSAMRKEGNGPGGGADIGTCDFGIGSPSRKDGEVESLWSYTSPYGGYSFTDLVLKGEPDPHSVGIRGFDVIQRPGFQYVSH